jgi:hypothetical protein
VCDVHGEYLAEEVVLEIKDLTEPTTIWFLGSAKTYEVKPDPTTHKARVEVLNVIQKAVDDPSYDGCDGLQRHLAAFRWFYRLAANPPASECSNNYYPCPHLGDMGGRKCPEVELLR